MDDVQLFTQEDRAALTALGSGGVDAPPAVGDEGSAHLAVEDPPPVEPKDPAVPDPGLALAARAADEAALANLTKIQERTQAQLEQLVAAMPKPAAPTADPAVDPRAAYAEMLKENPEFEPLVDTMIAQAAAIAALHQRLATEDAAKADVVATQAASTAMVEDMNGLFKKFPGLVRDDAVKVFNFIADEKNDDVVEGKSMREIAEDCLGYDYLHARRLPPGSSPGDPSPPSGKLRPAHVIDKTAAAGAAVNGSPTPEDGGDMRSVFQTVRRDPAQLARLGKWSP